jgi:3-methyladenine DNA glycosylase AlkD
MTASASAAPAVLAELERLGTAQNRKVYARHGVGGPMYGVSFANLKALKKRIGTDHALARALWASGNHDARVLATMIADPKQVDEALLDAWAADLDNYVVTDAFTGLVSKTTWARKKMEAWMDAEDEWLGSAGWGLLAHFSMKDDPLPDAYFEPFFEIIERRIHGAKNRVRYAMNNALIAIGARSDALAEKAIEAARRIGTVDVDHGRTSCKTPDAATYIPNARAHRRRKRG